MKTVFLFPGQGSQRAEMLDGFSSADAIASEAYTDVKEILGEIAGDLDSEQRLQSTVYTQLCLLIASVISARQLQAKGITPDFVAEHGKPDVIITDPPRAGMHADVVNRLMEIEAEKIVYVSCNAATQARDLITLKEKYDVAKIQPVDMFPHTQHVENVVLLVRRD